MKTVFGLVTKSSSFYRRRPLHMFSHQVMVLRFLGRRTGRRYAIPVSYYRDEMTGMVTCMTDASGVWWKNLLSEDAYRDYSERDASSCLKLGWKPLISKRSAAHWTVFAVAVASVRSS